MYKFIYCLKVDRKHVRMHLIFSITVLGIHCCLHRLRHWLLERLEVLWSDDVPNLLHHYFLPKLCCCFLVLLQFFASFHIFSIGLRSKLVRANLGRAELIHLYAISLHIGAKHQCAIFKRLEKNRPTDFAKSKSFLCSALISKQIKIQEPAWSHLIDFARGEFWKKNYLTAIKINQAMTL